MTIVKDCFSEAYLFMAGMLPGLMLADIYISYLVFQGIRHPEIAPRMKETYSWRARMASLKDLAPTLILILMVLGRIYAGVATPTDAAALGVLGAFLFAVINRSLSRRTFFGALMNAVRTTSMIMMIVIGAGFLSRVMGFLGIPAAITEFIVGLKLSPYMLMILLGFFYIIIGCLLDGFFIVVMTLPIALPMVTAAGFDPVWFGIYLVLMVEVSQITPPVGFNLFVVQGLTSASGPSGMPRRSKSSTCSTGSRSWWLWRRQRTIPTRNGPCTTWTPTTPGTPSAMCRPHSRICGRPSSEPGTRWAGGPARRRRKKGNDTTIIWWVT